MLYIGNTCLFFMLFPCIINYLTFHENEVSGILSLIIIVTTTNLNVGKIVCKEVQNVTVSKGTEVSICTKAAFRIFLG